MKHTSSVQRITVALLIGYVFWEIGIWIWARKLPLHDPLIRVDLIFIYPVLLILILISVYQYINHNSAKKK